MLALVFGLGLAHVDTPWEVVAELAEVIKSLLGILPLLEANEAEAARGPLLVLHHAR